MPAYVTLPNMMPSRYLIDGLDEDGDGQADPAVWARVAREVKAEIDTALEKRCAVPFGIPLPAIVVNFAPILAVEKVYAFCLQRRGTPGMVNPWAATATIARARLQEIALGNAPLHPPKAGQ